MAINATSFPYELTNITSSGNILEFVQHTNNLTGQLVMMGMLLAGFIILFISMREADPQDALVASTFITSILAISFYALDFIKGQYLTIIIILFAALFAFKVLKKS